MIPTAALLVIGIGVSAPNHHELAAGMTAGRREPSAREPTSKVYRVEFNTEIARGSGRFVVELAQPSEGRKAVVEIVGLGEKFIQVGTDGRPHQIKVPALSPVATKVTVDGTPIFAMFKQGEPVYFYPDMEVEWALVSSSIDPRMGRAPGVLCRRMDEPCPETFVVSRDPPLFRDKRCPDPKKARSATAKLCYLPGRVSFTSDVARSIELIEWTVEEPKILRTLRLETGKESEVIPLLYERNRPMGIRINGKDYFFAVGHGHRWEVRIDQTGGIEARERIP